MKKRPSWLSQCIDLGTNSRFAPASTPLPSKTFWGLVWLWRPYPRAEGQPASPDSGGVWTEPTRAGELLELSPEQQRSRTPAPARLLHRSSPAPAATIRTLFWDEHQPSSLQALNWRTHWCGHFFMLWEVLFFFFFWWQVLLSPIYIKTGLPALSLIPDPQVRGELWVTLRSHTFRSGHLSDKAFDVASFHVWGPQQGGEKLPRTQGSQTVLQQQLFIITVSYDVISQAPRCCRRKKEAIPCYQELQNILRKKKSGKG